MCRIKVSLSSGPLLLSLCLTAATAFAPPLPAQSPSSVAVRMIDPVDSSSDPAGKQYRATVTKAVNAADGVSIPQGAPAVVTLARSGNGSAWTTQLVSVTVNGQPVAVSTSSASVTAGAQSAASSAVSSVSSVLGSFGRPVRAPSSAATAIAIGQRVVLPPGTALSFVLSQPPAATPPAPAVAAAPAPAAAQPAAAPADFTSSAAPAPAQAATATRQPWFTQCRLQGNQDGHQVIYVTPIFRTDLAASDISTAFAKYMSANYDLSKILQASPGCSTKISNSPDQQAYGTQQLEKQWADSKIAVTHINWTGTSAEIQSTDTKAAAAQAALDVSPNDKYVYCISGATGPAVYFSDIFAAVPTSATFGPHAGRNGFPEFSAPFLTFLQKKYGYKEDSSSPTTCRAIFSPNPAGLHAAQTTKQAAEDQDKQANKQIVETGWKN